MTPNWTTLERQALENFLAGGGHLLSALEKFCAAESDQGRAMCADTVASSGSVSLAKAYAVEARTHATLIKRLEAAVGKSSAGPTG